MNKIISAVKTNEKKTAITYFSGPDTINMSFSDFNDTVNKVKDFLLKFGIKKGERVLLLSENHAKWLPVFIATTNYGAIAVPVDAQASNEKLLGILNDAKPRLVIVSTLFEEKMQVNFGNLVFPCIITNFYGDLILAKGEIKEGKEFPEPPVPTDPAMLIYTSGTSGKPKGIILSHEAIIAGIKHTTKIGKITVDDTMLTVLPYSHVYGLVNGALLPYYLGVKNVIAPTFNPLELLSLIQYHKATYVCFVPRLAEVFIMLLKSTGAKIEKLTIAIGGANAPKPVLMGLKAMGIKVAMGYGMTETCGGIIINFGDKLESSGKALDPVKIKLKNPVDGIGELLIKSPANTCGVWNNPEFTKEMWEEDYLRTGDMAKIDDEGFVTIMGRSKEVIVTSGGMNVYPDELEERIGYKPFIKEMGVIGLTENGSEFPALVIVPDMEKIPEDKKMELESYLVEEIENITAEWPEWEQFKRIVKYSEPLPRTNSFKVLRRALVDNVNKILTKHVEETEKNHIPEENIQEVFTKIKGLISGHLNIPEEEMELNANLSRFNRLDSLGKLSLLTFFEHNLSLEISKPSKEDFKTFHNLIKFLIKTNPIEKLLNIDLEAKIFEMPIPVPLDYSIEGIKRRQDFLELKAETKLDEIRKLDYENSEILKGNIENLFGFTQIPLGVAGPLKMNGEYADGEFYVPMATTEGALVASVSRGTQVITLSGGASVKVLADSVARTPIFTFDNLEDCFKFSSWVEENFEEIKTVAESTTRFGKLIEIEKIPLGTNLCLRFSYYCGDASGQNMVTMATHKAIHYISSQYKGNISDLFLECNISGDKKANGYNFTRNRGKKVVAHVLIPDEIVSTYLKTTSERMVKLFHLSTLGAVASHSFGSQAHYSNPITAVYIACGQDPACAAESAVGITHLEKQENHLSISVTLPDLMVGTVGGGTNLPTQKNCLEILGCLGSGKSKKFAEILAGTVLAAEISIIASMAADDFAKAHNEYGRKK